MNVESLEMIKIGQCIVTQYVKTLMLPNLINISQENTQLL